MDFLLFWETGLNASGGCEAAVHSKSKKSVG